MDDAARRWRVAKDGGKNAGAPLREGRLLLSALRARIGWGAGRGLTLHHLWGEPHEGSEAVGRERVQRTLCPRPGLLQGQEKVLERLPQRLLLPPLTRKLAHFLTLLQRG